MKGFWRPVAATGVIVAAAIGIVESSDAAGRLTERTSTGRSSSTKEPRERERTRGGEEASGGRLSGLRSSSSGRLAGRSSKRKDAPADAKAAKDALQEAGGLQIDFGEATASPDEPALLAPPPVPATEEEGPRATRPAATGESSEKGSRRSAFKRGETPATASLPGELKLLGPRPVR